MFAPLLLFLFLLPLLSLMLLPCRFVAPIINISQLLRVTGSFSLHRSVSSFFTLAPLLLRLRVRRRVLLLLPFLPGSSSRTPAWPIR